MNLVSFKEITDKVNLFSVDSNQREINVYELKNVIPIGESLFYPNVFFISNETNQIVNPIQETTMSLKGISKDIKFDEEKTTKNFESESLFYFIYNTDNYFHFVYDTLPYLISFMEMKKTKPNLKLLMNYPNPNKKEHYRFVSEFLDILGITDNDIKIIDENTEYSSILVSTSYTHDFDSNLPPRNEIYDLYREIVKRVSKDTNQENLPKKVYISRRSWLHGDFSNIGTNYTTKRKLVNEDSLVNFLVENGFTEVFTENMTTTEKILLFANVEEVVGAIGGGICNFLFSKKSCNLTAIISPFFLDINKRFLYSLNKVNLNLFDNTSHTENGEFKTYMRVKVDNIVGEITQVENDCLTISYSDTMLTAWNNDTKYLSKQVNPKDCIKLDGGLNSPWEINLDSFKTNF
jgi:capsular polysaccharide biosynthesis protein